MKRFYGLVLLALTVSAVSISVAAQPVAVTLRDVDVFAGPSSEFPPIGTLAPNTEVRVAGCLSDWSWCDVIFPQDRGWVYAVDLGYPYHNERVVILNNGPRLGLAVVTFSLGTYWTAHYRTHPFYAQRQQWESRVHVQADRGGPAPKGHAEARARAPEKAGAPQAGQPSAQAEQPRSSQRQSQASQAEQPRVSQRQPQASQAQQPQATQQQSQASERARAEPNARAGEKTARPPEESARTEEKSARTQQRETRQPEEKAQSENARSQQQSARQPEVARPQQSARASDENARPPQQGARPTEDKASASRQSGQQSRQPEKGRAEERRQPEESNRQPDSERQ